MSKRPEQMKFKILVSEKPNKNCSIQTEELPQS